ncbi:hypothetical protein VNO80_29734 [Phaseolus coccineus]|uniref:Uncharacterized protein n=1 Tax=Phaseolus coccineus TaxID=3886 RepID=A0AAN9QCQ8_PHACN
MLARAYMLYFIYFLLFYIFKSSKGVTRNNNYITELCSTLELLFEFWIFERIDFYQCNGHRYLNNMMSDNGKV